MINRIRGNSGFRASSACPKCTRFYVLVTEKKVRGSEHEFESLPESSTNSTQIESTVTSRIFAAPSTLMFGLIQKVEAHVINGCSGAG